MITDGAETTCNSEMRIPHFETFNVFKDSMIIK